MSGHSKWSTIKRKKGALDQKRGKSFSIISKEITIAARLGGGSIDDNPRLRLAIKKAKSLNMPNVNIEKAIKKGTGEIEGLSIEEVTYEGFGPFGVAFLIEGATDNKNRTVADVRHAFNKFGGSLGQNGSVAWNFNRYGVIQINRDNYDEEKVFDLSIQCNAEDFFIDDDAYRLIFNPNELYSNAEKIEKNGIEIENSFLAFLPNEYLSLKEEEFSKVNDLIDFLDELEDVQNVFTNLTLKEDS